MKKDYKDAYWQLILTIALLFSKKSLDIFIISVRFLTLYVWPIISLILTAYYNV